MLINGGRRGDGLTGEKAAAGFDRRFGNGFIAFHKAQAHGVPPNE